MVWPQIAYLVVALVVSYALRPKTQPQKLPGFQDVEIPTAEVGKEIPVVFGTKIIRAPNVVGAANLRTAVNQSAFVLRAAKHFSKSMSFLGEIL